MPEPVDDLPLNDVSGSELVALLNQRAERLHSLRALLQLQARGNIIPIRRSINVSVSYLRPALIRIRAFDPLGHTLFDLTSDRTHFRVRLPTQNRVVTGTHASTADATAQETSATRQRMLHFARAISATILAAPIDAADAVTVREDGALYRIDVANPSRPAQPIRQLWVERINLDLVKEAVFSDTGEPIVTVEFEDYRALGPRREIPYPFRMSIHDAEMDSDYTLTFQEVLPNPEFSPTEFADLP